MIKYLKIELYKLNKSTNGKISLLLVSALFIIYSLIAFYRSKNIISAIQFSMYMFSNINNTFAIYFITILMTTFMFAKEFEDRTFTYIFCRPVSWIKLFITKILAILIFLGEIILGIFVLSFIIGALFWNISKIPGLDLNLLQSITRMCYYYISSWFNLVFIISLTIFISILLKKQIGTMIASCGVFFILALFVSYIPENITYSTPTIYLFLSFFIKTNIINFMNFVYKGMVISFLYSLIIIVFTFFITLRIRKEI
jgi:ABC-2 type transport system permease protein